MNFISLRVTPRVVQQNKDEIVSFQAVLPLRGKVINTEKAKLADIIKNEEINTIIYTIGSGCWRRF